MFDDNDEIKSTCFEILEELGMVYEEENEEKLREIKQLGFHSEWTYEGRVENSLKLPMPITQRPRLGARKVVSQYTRRFLNALYKEVTSWVVDAKERASYLLLFCIIYSED